MRTHAFFLSLSLATALSLSANAAFATVETSVDFPAGQKNGNFNCTFDGSGQIHVTTDQVKVKGYCVGDPNVPVDGQLQTGSDSVKDYYFSIKKSAAQNGKVNVMAMDEGLKAITCVADKSGKQEYPYGSKYC